MKSKKSNNILQSIIGFALLGILCCFFIWLLITLGSILLEVDAKISASIIGAMSTVIVGVIAVVWTQRQIKIREIEETHRPKKVELYQTFIKVVTSLIAGANENLSAKGMSEQELIDTLFEFKKDLLLWGSPKVIKALLKFDSESGSGGKVVEAIDSLYKAIREDIGLSNKGLDNLELPKLFLKDPTELDK
ncbi:MAG: hypothetical protein ACI8PB_000685 [Desulforhopalus sp.]|jgi:hypothetical protein